MHDVCASASACLRAIAKVCSGSLCLPFNEKPKQMISSLRIEHQGSSQFVYGLTSGSVGISLEEYV